MSNQSEWSGTGVQAKVEVVGKESDVCQDRENYLKYKKPSDPKPPPTYSVSVRSARILGIHLPSLIVWNRIKKAPLSEKIIRYGEKNSEQVLTNHLPGRGA